MNGTAPANSGVPMSEKPDDFLFPNAARQREAQQQQGLIFAQRYLVFSGPTADPRARELLEHWTRTVRAQRIAPNASAQELAYYNARREFVEAIHEQIEMAMKGAQSLPPVTRTTTNA